MDRQRRVPRIRESGEARRFYREVFRDEDAKNYEGTGSTELTVPKLSGERHQMWDEATLFMEDVGFGADNYQK